ncbi:MAG TPA: fused MFS/spermidine synthase [Candidatus Limnocylindrales bacterium]|nr:fused MFS/spermidine synthase [Candidatus Limnocylindrales bacterium]
MTAAILAIFVLSGAAGLIYEVVWARELVLVFGNTTQAVSAILTGFFGGMAIGSWVGGRVADRVRRPLRMYGLLELVLVAVVLVTPFTFALIKEAYRGVFGGLETTPTLLALVRFVLALLALGPATILMGATLPTLTRYLTTDRHLSRAFGRLYAANTFGAIIGTGLAGFVLIELLGLSGSVVVGAACSGVAGLAALLLARARRVRATEAVAVRPEEVDSPAVGSMTDRSWPRLALAVAFASGLTSLGYQTLWTRLLASGTGNSTYVFSTILAIFLVGLALGAIAFSLVRSRVGAPIGLLALGQVLVAILVIAGMAVIDNLAAGTPLSLTTHPRALLTDFALPVAAVVLPATFVMGFMFPAASALLPAGVAHSGGSAGALLAVNTVGAIVGTFLVPFVVIPLVGSPTALALLVVVNLVVGLALAWVGVTERAGRLAGGAASVGAAVVAVGVAATIVSGGFWVDPGVRSIIERGGHVDASREDEIASVQAGSMNGAKRLWVTGVSMTALTVDAHLMPILPLIARPDSARALVIAFGMGTAYRASLAAGLETDGVELVPSVPLMFGDFYGDAEQVLSDPHGRVLIADGRNHVELTDARYDIVVVDPPPPIESAGVSVISSLEFYRATHDRLNPGGVMMQWVPFGQQLDEFKAHIRTFETVFPNVVVAIGPGGNGFYMLGSDRPITFDPATMRSVLERPGILADISSAPDSPRHTLDEWMTLLPSIVRLSGPQVAAFTGPGPLITDDHPLPEYFLLRHAFGTSTPQVTSRNVRAP